MFLGTTVSHELLQLHEHVIGQMLNSGAEISPYFRAGTWVPHCTLAVGIERARMAAAFAACIEAFQPITVQLRELVGAEIGSADAPAAHRFALRDSWSQSPP